jgi:hypothetical protein
MAPIGVRNKPEACVLELKHEEVEWVRGHWQTTLSKNEGSGTTAEGCAYLEIQPRGIDLEALRGHIKAASGPRIWHGVHIWRDFPVSITAEGLIRVQWSGRQTVVTPRLKRALAMLGTHLSVRPEVEACQDFTVPVADQRQMEQRIVELVEQGRLLDATKLARQRYGYSLSEARTFVEQLRGG